MISTHAYYNPYVTMLVYESKQVMCVVANCPDVINYNAVCSSMCRYVKWTKDGPESGKLPTVSKQILLPEVQPVRKR